MSGYGLVRGRTRQRRKAPKTKTGCLTCKIRRIKCDETKPVCDKCSSTGRKCDGYKDVPPPDLNKSKTTSLNGPLVEVASVEYQDTKREDCKISREGANSFELPNAMDGLPHALLLVPLDSSADATSGRLSHYFIHGAAIDLTGPFHMQVWNDYILSLCTASAAVQRATWALSGLHERYSFSDHAVDENNCWKQYYLAVKETQALANIGANSHGQPEILAACAIFITIEILLGNIDAAIRHIESGMALIRQDLISAGKTNSTVLMDGRLVDLIGLFARLNLQVLSLLPHKHHSSLNPNDISRYELTDLSQPLPNALSSSLYRIIKSALYWIQHCALPFKYSTSIPAHLMATRDALLTALRKWHRTFTEVYNLQGRINHVDAKAANLLMAYYLLLTRVTVSLESRETIFDDAPCREYLQEIMRCSEHIIHARQHRRASHTVALRDQCFFTLEASTVEALYYVALKCRNGVLRREAIGLLKVAGREGIWDGSIMGRVAEYAMNMEEGVNDSEIGGKEDNSRRIEEKLRINTVNIDLPKSGGNTVEIECGWFIAESRVWRRRTTSLCLVSDQGRFS